MLDLAPGTLWEASDRRRITQFGPAAMTMGTVLTFSGCSAGLKIECFELD
jgi:hypothetical protein